MAQPSSAVTTGDRLLVGGSVAVWLGVVGAFVTAGVAIGQRGTTVETVGGGTPTALYVVIGVSAAVIAVAVPLLLRARRAETVDAGSSLADPDASALRPDGTLDSLRAGDRGVGAPAVSGGAVPGVRGFDPDRRFVAAADRLWLRSAAAIVGGVGVALLGCGVGACLLATDNDLGAWICLGVAGAVTLALPALPPWLLRDFSALAEHLRRI